MRGVFIQLFGVLTERKPRYRVAPFFESPAAMPSLYQLSAAPQAKCAEEVAGIVHQNSFRPRQLSAKAQVAREVRKPAAVIMDIKHLGRHAAFIQPVIYRAVAIGKKAVAHLAEEHQSLLALTQTAGVVDRGVYYFKCGEFAKPLKSVFNS